MSSYAKMMDIIGKVIVDCGEDHLLLMNVLLQAKQIKFYREKWNEFFLEVKYINLTFKEKTLNLSFFFRIKVTFT